MTNKDEFDGLAKRYAQTDHARRTCFDIERYAPITYDLLLPTECREIMRLLKEDADV
jgi:hypothetical protein